MQLLAGRIDPPPAEFDTYPPSFVARWRSDDGTDLLEVIPAFDVTDPERAAAFVDEVQQIAPNSTGLPVVYERSGTTVVQAFTQAFTYAAIAISVMLIYFMRSAVDMSLVMVPLALAALITAGISISAGLSFNFANIIALPLLMGIGVDNGIHIVHRVRAHGASGSAVLSTSTARAILFSSMTTLASFGTLALSSHRGMASMGALLAIGLAVILVVMLTVLPTLLDWRQS